MSENLETKSAEDPPSLDLGKTTGSTPWLGPEPFPDRSPDPEGEVAKGASEQVSAARVNPFSPDYVRRRAGPGGDTGQDGSPDPGSLAAPPGAVPVVLIPPSGGGGAGPAVGSLPEAQPSAAAALAKEVADRQWWQVQQRNLQYRANLALALAVGALAGLGFLFFSGYYPLVSHGGRFGDGQFPSGPGVAPMAKTDARPLLWPEGKPEADTQALPSPGAGLAEDRSRQAAEAELEMQLLRMDSRLAALEKAQGEFDQALVQLRFARLEAPVVVPGAVGQQGSAPAGKESRPVTPEVGLAKQENQHPAAPSTGQIEGKSTSQFMPAAAVTGAAGLAGSPPLPEPSPAGTMAAAEGLRYGIQLATLSTTEAIPGLVRLNGLDPGNLYLLAAGQRSILILGFFPSPDQARTYLEGLPSGLKKARPIVRSFPPEQLLQPYKLD